MLPTIDVDVAVALPVHLLPCLLCPGTWFKLSVPNAVMVVSAGYTVCTGSIIYRGHDNVVCA